jgi:murein DD-endopeptidase MepM/ murein hydrolase activator NlpD
MYGHNGLDFGMSLNTALLACVDGVMSYLGNDPTGYGLYGVLRDSSGTEWLYGHAARWHVKQGAMVAAGQHIADADSTGNSTGNHLHFGRRPAGYNRGDGYFGYSNPRPFLELPYAVLLQAGHYPNAGGAPREAEWTMLLAQRLQARLQAAGVFVGIVGDYYGKTPPVETHSDWDLYVSIHYDAFQPPSYTSGGSVARGDYETEHWEADRFVNLWKSRYPNLTQIPLAMQRVNPNMTQYYGFRPLSDITPGVLVEHGCGMGDDRGKLWDGIDSIADADTSILLEYLGISREPTPQPGDGELVMDTTPEQRAEMKSYFEQLGIPVNMETGLMQRAALAKARQEERGPAISGEYTTRNRDGVLVARQRFSGGTLDYHLEGASQGQTFWGEVNAHPEDAA